MDILVQGKHKVRVSDGQAGSLGVPEETGTQYVAVVQNLRH